MSAKTDARLKRIFRGFWGNDRATQRRQIREAMEVMDPNEKVWRRDKAADAARKLTTEADGRALAIKMLREGGELSVDATCLYPTGDDIRGGRPQNNYALRYLKRLRKADNEDVYRGFASVLSDVFGALREGVPDADYYETQEQEAALGPDVYASLIREPGHA